MPQFFGWLIGIVIALEIVRWVVQWIWVCVIWFWDVLLMPFFIFFSPALLIVLASTAIYWGAWVATQNYFLSLKANIVSDDLADTLTRKYIILVLTLFLVSIYLSLAISSVLFIYGYGKEFGFHVAGYYQSIKFPEFIIRPLFGKDQAESLPTNKTTLERIDITLRNDNCWNHDFYANNNFVTYVSAQSSTNFRISPGTYVTKVCAPGTSNCGASTNVVWEKPTTHTISQHPDCFGRYSNKTEIALSGSSASTMVNRMIDYALNDGGLSHESEIQQTKRQLEGLPKPEKGNKKAARAINDKGLASSKDYDFNNAVKLFEEANSLDKSDIEIVSNLGFSYLKQGNLDLAQQAIITTLIMSPGRAIAWANLGEVFGAKGDVSRAVACFSNTYRFSKDRSKTHQFMIKLNETENLENVKKARAIVIDWAAKSYPDINY